MKKTTNLDDLSSLAKLATTKEWKVYCRMAENRIQYQKDKIVSLSEVNPMKLAVNKAFERGLMTGVILSMKDVNNASNELQKLEEKEE